MTGSLTLADLAAHSRSEATLVTIGVFDGVHRGHQRLLAGLVDQARQAGLTTVAITFFPHPDVVLRSLGGRHYLTRPEEKEKLLRAQGIDEVLTLTFDDQLRRVRAEEFCARLRSSLNMQTLAVGRDFALGHRREGNVQRLRQLGRELGFGLLTNELVEGESGRISSTAIREALEAGVTGRARCWLGRSHVLGGEVVRGAGRGRRLGFPTANIDLWEQQVIPANGVYASYVWLGDERFVAATNVGRRPHFAGATLTVEPYILDFDRDVYGQWLNVSFEQRLRDEQKFGSLDGLVTQIAADAEASRALLGN